nr:MAG TPA: hypothetical protein [Caudoviricetes sp.]
MGVYPILISCSFFDHIEFQNTHVYDTQQIYRSFKMHKYQFIFISL